MTHRIDLRIPDDLYKKLRKQSGTMTYSVCTALREYLRTDDVQDPYNKSIIELMQSQITDLRNDKEYLQGQVNALMVARSPTLKEWFMYRLRGKTEK
jgi:hypothetical protein